MEEKKTILITGAAGNIGKKLRTHLSGRYALKLLDMAAGGDPSITAMDLSVWDEQLVYLFKDVDVLVHLAADPYDNKSWEELIPSNLDALNNVFVSAVLAKVPRVVFASSNHVMEGTLAKRELDDGLPQTLNPSRVHITNRRAVICATALRTEQ